MIYHNRVATVTTTLDALTFEIETLDRDGDRTLVRFCGLGIQDGNDEAVAPAELADGVCVRLLLPPSPTRDAKGRLLAYVLLEQSRENLNERLLADGLASADRKLEHPLKSKYEAIERRARQRGAGHWTKAAPQVHASTVP